MCFQHFPWDAVPTYHISYHLQEHYNAVRRLDDDGKGPALPISHELKEIESSAKKPKKATVVSDEMDVYDFACHILDSDD